MRSRGLILSVALLPCAASLGLAQAPTPTPIDSNIAVSVYAQGRGQDLQGNQCATIAGDGCGGCYPEPIPSSDPVTAALQILNVFNPEWQAIGPMIPGVDMSRPPVAVPVRITGTVGLSKSPGDDFPGSHLSSDYNAEIVPDDNGRLATGNTNQRIEFEWEGDKFPLFAWAGEGDRIIAYGRWIFDCGHPDPGPQGNCSNDATAVCIVDADCGSGGTCTAPAPVFGFQSELHPPQAAVMIRNKSIGATPATRADVYISSDAGGAGDRCTVTHLADYTQIAFSKACFLNHCSVTTARSCKVDADCAKGETCMRFDPNGRLADINTADFEFDMPLPPRPPSATKVKIKTKNHNPKGTVMPKAITVPDTTAPTPVVHVTVPMTTPIKGKMPDIFAQSISAAWIGDKTTLTHVHVKFTKLTVSNPVKASTPPFAKRCTNPAVPPGGLTDTSCTVETDCPAGSCASGGAPCHANSECARTDYCKQASHCVGGITPGWRAWAEVNGDWIEFPGLATLGAQNPFSAPPYVQPSSPLTIPLKFKFDEFVPADGSVHIKASGRSFNCLNALFGNNLIDLLHLIGFQAGADCLLKGGSTNPGTVDITHSGPGFATTTGTPATCQSAGGLTTCQASPPDGDGGTCSATSNRLCVADADCPTGETCSVAGGAFTLNYTITVLK